MVDTYWNDEFKYTLPIQAFTSDGYVLYLGRAREVPTINDGFQTSVFERIEGGLAVAARVREDSRQPYLDLPVLNNAAPDIVALKANKRVAMRSFGGHYARRGVIKQANNAAKVTPNQGHKVLADQATSRFSVIDPNTGIYTELAQVPYGGTAPTAAQYSQGAGAAWDVDGSLIGRPYDLYFPEPAENKVSIGTRKLGALTIIIPIVTDLGRLVTVELNNVKRASGDSGNLLSPSDSESVRLQVESPDEGDCDFGVVWYWEPLDNVILDECAA